MVLALFLCLFYRMSLVTQNMNIITIFPMRKKRATCTCIWFYFRGLYERWRERKKKNVSAERYRDSVSSND